MNIRTIAQPPAPPQSIEPDGKAGLLPQITITDDATNPARLGLYIHIPFCARKCPYCDFNTYAGMENQIDATVDALCQEMQRWQEPLRARTINTIFLGGGTPTLLTAAQLSRLFTAIHANFALESGCEITSEANPGTVDRAKFEILHDLGVNRLSIGVQSFQPDELAFLGRIHDVQDVYQAFAAARAAGFANINLDFIFGLPTQPLANWAKTLDEALALAPEHLSLYSLIVEPNTPLQHWVATGKVNAPDDDLAAAHYDHAIERLAAAGYLHYEISNWAKATAQDATRQGKLLTTAAQQTPTLASQHNLIYWRNQEYIGIGPGAHSHLRTPTPEGLVSGRRWGNRKPVPSYVKRILAGTSVEEFSENIDPRTALGETMMLGLRLVREGVPLARFAALHQVPLTEIFAQEIAQLQTWGLIELDSTRIRLSTQGIFLGNQVFAYFLPD